MLSAVTLLILIVGLVQLPILTDLLIFLFPSSPLPRLASRATKPIFVLLFLACCALALYLFFSTFLPLTLHSLLAHRSASPPTVAALAACLTALACYIIANMLYHYTVASFAAASPTPAPLAPPHTRACVQCGSGKGPRIHHCRICNRCTALMDHHCPFTANCVGSATLRPFYLWLSFCLVGLVYGATLSWPAFNRCIAWRWQLPAESTGDFTFTTEWFPPALLSPSPGAALELWSRRYCKSLSNAPWTFLLVAFGLLPVAALWALQTLLIHYDRTTLELIAAFGRRGQKTAAVVTAVEGDGGEAGKGSAGGEVALSRALRKEWALIHRHEALYRLLAPDPLWRLCGRSRAKHKR